MTKGLCSLFLRPQRHVNTLFLPQMSGAADHCTCRTDVALRTYLAEFFLINVTDAELDKVLTLYPQDLTHISPFDTGTQNAFTPEFKRIASLLGDFTL